MSGGDKGEGGTSDGSAQGAGQTQSENTGSSLQTIIGLGALLYSVLQRPPSIDQLLGNGPINLSAASEGRDTAFVIGKRVKVTGLPVWMSPVYDDAGTDRVDVAVAWCHNVVDEIIEIRGRSSLLWMFDVGGSAPPGLARISLVSDRISVTLIGASQANLQTTDPNTDLSIFKPTPQGVASPAFRLTWAGFVNPLNNGTLKVIDVVESPIIQTKSTPGGGDEGEGATVTLIEDVFQFNPDLLVTLANYRGLPTQIQDPTIVSWHGVDNSPAYEGICYTLIAGLDLQGIGGSLPDFTAILQESATDITIKDAFDKIIARFPELAGLTDTTQLSSEVMRGYSVPGIKTLLDQLTPMMTAYDVIAQNDQGIIKFLHRVDAPTVAIDPDDLSCSVSEDGRVRPLAASDLTDVKLPSSVSITFIDETNGFDTGSIVYRRRDVAATNDLNVVLPIVLTASRATQIAKRLAWTPWGGSRTIRIQLPLKYLHIIENDVLTFTTLGENWSVIATRVDRGDNNCIEIESIINPANILTQLATSVDPGGGTAFTTQGESFHTPPRLAMHIMDIAALNDAEAEEPHYYVAMNPFGTKGRSPEPFTMALHESKDAGATWKVVKTKLARSTMGTAKTALGSTDARVGLFDRVNTVTVDLYRGSLSSTTDAGILRGVNLAMLGGEVFAFRDATLQSDGTYKLSVLMRGLKDTDANLTGHAVFDTFVLLDENVAAIPIQQGDVGVTRLLSAVAQGDGPLAASATSFTPLGGSILPFKPMDAALAQGLGDDLTISWRRRSRSPHVKILSRNGLTLRDTPERYAVDVYSDGTFATKLRTLDNITTTQTTYGATEQAADFGAAQSTLNLEIFQKNAKIGNGRARRVTVSV